VLAFGVIRLRTRFQGPLSHSRVVSRMRTAGILWGSETPSSSIPDLGAAFVPIVLAARTSPKSCSNPCSNPGGIHRRVATRGGLKPRDAVNSNGLWRLPPNRALLRFGTVRSRVQIPGPRPGFSNTNPGTVDVIAAIPGRHVATDVATQVAFGNKSGHVGETPSCPTTPINPALRQPASDVHEPIAGGGASWSSSAIHPAG
jgi:hypothetical protein